MSDELPIIFSYGSDVGRIREHNEDAVAAGDSTDPQKKHLGRLFIVADGMGGYLAGEVASELAVETVLREYYADAAAEPVTGLQNAVQAANHAVYSSAHTDRSRAGMGTTIVATVIVGRTVYVASVGDSRAYVVHNGELMQITQDHSLVGEQIRAGLITKEQARTHPQRNVITRALGSQPVVTPDIFEGKLSDGDILIMCTDGLTSHVPDERLYEMITQLPPHQAVGRLIELAKQGGGTDNISVIVVRLGQPAPVTQAAAPQPAAIPIAASTPAAAEVVRAPIVSAPTRSKRGISPVWVAVGAALAFMAVAAAGVLGIGLGGIWMVRNEHTLTPAIVPTGVRPDTPVAPTVKSLPGAAATATGMPTTTLPLISTATPTRLSVLTATATAVPASPPTPSS